MTAEPFRPPQGYENSYSAHGITLSVVDVTPELARAPDLGPLPIPPGDTPRPVVVV